MHSLLLSLDVPFSVLELKLVASGQIKSSSRKPLLLRHFQLSVNQLLLARIFYSPIVAPNVKFGFVLCALHRWSPSPSENLIEHFLTRIDTPLYRSSDELAIIFNEIQRGKIEHYQPKKSTVDHHQSLQRLCRLFAMLNSKQLPTFEQQFLEKYREKLSSILQSLFAKTLSKLTPTEALIYSICCETDQPSISSPIFPCPLCNAALVISRTDLLVASCSNKHHWPRCSRTLLPLALEEAQTCALCDRSITSTDTNEKNYSNFLQYQEKELNFFFSSLCTYCLGIH